MKKLLVLLLILFLSMTEYPIGSSGIQIAPNYNGIPTGPSAYPSLTGSYNPNLATQNPYGLGPIGPYIDTSANSANKQTGLPTYFNTTTTPTTTTPTTTTPTTTKPDNGTSGINISGKNVGDRFTGPDGRTYRVVDPSKGIYEPYRDSTWPTEVSSGPSAEELAANQVRSDINSGYDNYFSTLDSILNNDLPAQRAAQEGIVQSQGTQAQTTLDASKTQGLADLNTQRRQTEQGQAKNLQGLAEDVRNLFKAGSIKLGAMGAGDSSAANQYSYAISKMGNQNRGNIMQQATEINNQINDREFKLKSTYDSELANIKEQVNQKSMEIATWFSQQQQAIQQAKASGQLQKGQDLASLSKQILGQAQNALLMAQQQAASKQSALETWAMNNSTTIQQLKQNMAALPGVAQQIQGQPLQGNLQGSQSEGYNYVPSGGGGNYNTGGAAKNEEWWKNLPGGVL